MKEDREWKLFCFLLLDGRIKQSSVDQWYWSSEAIAGWRPLANSTWLSGKYFVCFFEIDEEIFLFIKNGYTPFHLAARDDSRNEILKLFLSSKIDVECRCFDDGGTALHVACLFKATKNVATLLDNGASVLAKTTDGDTPKQLAIASGANDNLIVQLEAAEKVWFLFEKIFIFLFHF